MMSQSYFSMLLVSAVALLFACGTPQEKQPKPKTSGWIPLFDGKTLNGWSNYGKQTIGSAWKVENGTLRLDVTDKEDWQAANGGDIVTEREFENFHLSLEWKIAKDGNSGIMFYVQEDTTKWRYPWQTGPEMQILDDTGHPDAKIEKHRAADLYDLIEAQNKSLKQVGEWNKAEIIANQGHLQFFLNGTMVVEQHMWEQEWKDLIAGSKFNEMPDFGTFKKGKIALQDHGNNVWFRDIKIKEL